MHFPRGNQLKYGKHVMNPLRHLLFASLTSAAAICTHATVHAAEPSPAGSAPVASIALDPLGLALFGPSLSADVGIQRFSAGARFRWFSPGLLANALFLADDDKFGFSYGLGVNSQYFFLSPLSGPHIGLSLELLNTKVDDDLTLIRTKSTYVIPQLEGGYRHRLGQFFVGAAAGVGYAARASSTVENLPGGDAADSYLVADESSVYGTVRLDLGIYF